MNKCSFGTIVLILAILIASCTSLPKLRESSDALLVHPPKGEMGVYFIDLDLHGGKGKSGDCIIIITPEGKTVMIDCGKKDTWPEIDYTLKRLHIDHIDAFFLSHFHSDHDQGFDTLVGKYPVGKVYMNEMDDKGYVEYDQFMTPLLASKIPYERIRSGWTGNIGGVQVACFSPVGDMEPRKSDKTAWYNNSSLALRFSYGDSSFFFGGDLYSKGEYKIVDAFGNTIHSDVAKANHHGYPTSNSHDWIVALAPKYVVAMHDKVADVDIVMAYRKNGARYYCTAENGFVVVFADDKGHYTVKNEFDNWMNDVL